MSKFIPVTQLPSRAEFDERGPTAPAMSWDFEFPPHLDQERIVIDVGHLRRIQTVGAFSANHVLGYQGDQTQYSYSLRGINADGSGIAGKETVAVKAETSKSVLHNEDAPMESALPNYFKISADHLLNKPELAQKVIGLRGKPSLLGSRSDEEYWAQTVDTTIQKSMMDTARSHLLGRPYTFTKAVNASVIALDVGSIGFNLTSHNYIAAASNMASFAGYIGLLVGIDTARNYANYGETFISKRRWSMFENMQPDRYVALNALTRVSSLVRARK